MILFNSFSMTYSPRVDPSGNKGILFTSFNLSMTVPSQYESQGNKGILFRSFALYYSPYVHRLGNVGELFNSFSFNIPYVDIIDQNKLPFGLITHKKK